MPGKPRRRWLHRSGGGAMAVVQSPFYYWQNIAMRHYDETAFLFALKEKISPDEAARCYWTDVRGDMWNTRRCLGLTAVESCHFRLATRPAPPSRFVGSAQLAGEHNMFWSEWMVLEEASSFDTNPDTPVESCSSLSPQISFPMYLIHRGHLLLTLPCWDAWSRLLKLAIFGTSCLGSVPPDEHADSFMLAGAFLLSR